MKKKRKKTKNRSKTFHMSKKQRNLLLIVFFIILLLVSIRHFSNDDIKHLGLVDKYSKEYGIDRSLILGLIEVESNFNENALSNKGRIGLMQIMPDTGKWISTRLDLDYSQVNLNDPETNIRFGTYYISYLIDRFDYLHLALAAYNGGPGNVDKWIERDILNSNPESVDNIPFEETREYVGKVLEASKGY